jgi:hypothetical protein
VHCSRDTRAKLRTLLDSVDQDEHTQLCSCAEKAQSQTNAARAADPPIRPLSLSLGQPQVFLALAPSHVPCAPLASSSSFSFRLSTYHYAHNPHLYPYRVHQKNSLPSTQDSCSRSGRNTHPLNFPSLPALHIL